MAGQGTRVGIIRLFIKNPFFLTILTADISSHLTLLVCSQHHQQQTQVTFTNNNTRGYRSGHVELDDRDLNKN